MSNAYATIHGAITEALWCYEDGAPTIGSELEEQIGHITADACDDLTTTPQIIRTVEELEALDHLTVVYTTDRDTPVCAGDLIDDIDYDTYYAEDIPAAVIATAAQVRAARKALREA